MDDPLKTLVELHNVSVRQGRAVILSDITWTLVAGQNWAILGRNGAGKTTFLKLVRGDIGRPPVAVAACSTLTAPLGRAR